MTNNQHGQVPEALRLADELNNQATYHREVASDCDMRPEDTINWAHGATCDRAATELRRLHAENETLRTQQPAPCATCASLARSVMLDQTSFDRKPDCYGIRQITDDEGVEEWEDIRTSPDVAREEANDMMATGRGEIYEVVPLWTTPQPAPATQQAGEMPESIEQLAVARYKVAPAHESMFHRWAVVAGDGAQQLYLGREVECENMARKFAGAFLDGAFVAMQQAAPQQEAQEPVAWLSTDSIGERYLCFTKPNDSDPVRPLVFGDNTPQPAPATQQAGWTSADADAARLALELECLLMDTKDTAVVSKWWQSANEALELHRARLQEVQPSPTAQSAPAAGAVAGPDEVAALQRALAFWLPHVPDRDHPIGDRIASDAMLLAGYMGEDEPDAFAMGYITLQDAAAPIRALKEGAP